MLFSSPSFVTRSSALLALLYISHSHASEHHFLNTTLALSVPTATTVESLTVSLAESTTLPVPNVTLHNTTTVDALSPASLPTDSPDGPGNITSTQLHPNTTSHSTTNTTINDFHGAFNTSRPAAPYANATQTQWFTQANATSTKSGPTPPPVNLAPAIPPTIDPLDPIVLQPNRTVELYFQAPRPNNGSGMCDHKYSR